MSEQAEAAAGDLVVVSVGTDYHRFDRLVAWIDDWAARHPEVRVVVQHGSAQAPEHCESYPLIPYDELCQLFASASAVVSHGGPSTVMDARSAGRVPIVVPRDPRRGEHVDDHQIRFSQHLARHGLAAVAQEFDQLVAAIEAMITEPTRHRVQHSDDGPPGVAAFGRVLGDVLDARSHRRVRP